MLTIHIGFLIFDIFQANVNSMSIKGSCPLNQIEYSHVGCFKIQQPNMIVI